MTDTFETFWTDWLKPPRRKHENRAEALKAYNRALKRGATHEGIAKAAARYKGSFSSKDSAFVRLASTWLNNDGHKEDYDALAENAMGYHTIQGPPQVTVGGRIFKYLELRKIRRTILAGNPVYEDEWKAFKEWQAQGNDKDVRLPPEPAQPPTAEERAAEIRRLKEAGLL